MGQAKEEEKILMQQDIAKLHNMNSALNTLMVLILMCQPWF